MLSEIEILKEQTECIVKITYSKECWQKEVDRVSKSDQTIGNWNLYEIRHLKLFMKVID